MGEGVEERREALSLFCFHLFPFPPEMPDTQARLRYNMWTYSDCYTCICVVISFFLLSIEQFCSFLLKRWLETNMEML